MPTSRKYIEIAYVFVISANVFLIPFGMRATIIAMSVWLAQSLLIVVMNSQKIKFDRENIITIITILTLLIVQFISVQFGTNKMQGYKILGTMSVIPVIPLLLTINRNFIQKNMNLLLKIFVSGNLIALTYLLLRASYYVYYLQTAYFHEKFFYTPFSVFLHPSYAGMSALFSLIVILYFMNNKKDDRPKPASKFMVILLLIFLSLGIYLFSSVAVIISYIFVCIVVFLYLMLNKKIKYINKAVIIVILATGVYLVSKNERISVKIEKYTEVFQQSSGKTDIRLELWKTALKIGTQNIAIGTSPGDVVADISKMRMSPQSYNAHNQFLEIFASSGALGISVFLFLLLIQLKKIIQCRSIYYLLIDLVLLLNLLFESMLVRFSGALMFAYLIGIILLMESKKVKII